MYGVCLSVCLSICLKQYYVKSYQEIFVKPCKNINYCYKKKNLNFAVNPFQRGWTAAILVFL